MRYGKFDNKNKEYIIQTYDTPLPWINYLTNGNMFSLISSLGGGYSYYKDAKLRRITRYTYNTPCRDNDGRLIYIDDGKDVFSPCFMPSKTPLDSYECHVGLNYNRYVSSKNSILMDLLCFIPKDDNVEINKLVIKNESDEEKTISIISVVEFCLWNALDDMTNFQRNFSIGEVEVENNTIYHKSEYRERRNHFSFYHVNCDIDSFDTDRDSFVGLHGDYTSPLGVKNRKLSNSIASGWSPIAMTQIEIKLKPGESKILIYLLGYVENKQQEKFDKFGKINKVKSDKLIQKYSSIDNVDYEFNRLCSSWDDLLKTYKISSNCEELDTAVDIWNQYQCTMTYYLSRSASYYESGIDRKST